MLMTAVCKVTGVKRFKGEVEGREYDNCKVFIEVPLDDSQGNGKGFCTEAYAFGKSANYDQFDKAPFPLTCEVDFTEVGTGGGGSKRVIAALRVRKA